MKNTKLILLFLFIFIILSGCYKVKYEITIAGRLTKDNNIDLTDKISEPIAERITYTNFNKEVMILDVSIPWEKTVYILKSREGKTPINFSANFYYGDNNIYRGIIYLDGDRQIFREDSIYYSNLENKTINNISTRNNFVID